MPWHRLDVFILDLGDRVIQWNGKGSGTTQRQKALLTTASIKAVERKGNAAVAVVDQDDANVGPEKEFWAAFGEARPDAAALDAAVAVAESKLPAVAAPSSVKLYRLSDEGVGRGEVAVEEVLHRPVNARVKSPKWGRTV